MFVCAITTSAPFFTHPRYFKLNTTINTLNCLCAFFQKLYQSAMTLDRTWIKRWDYFGNTPFLFSCIHLTKSPQTLVKWAFQDTIKNSLHTFLPYFKHFLKIFVIHSVDLCHIILLIVMLYSHLFFYTIYRNLCIVKKNAYKACNINVCREFLFINSFVIYTIYRNVSAVNKKSCNHSKIKGFQTWTSLNCFSLFLLSITNWESTFFLQTLQYFVLPSFLLLIFTNLPHFSHCL